MAFEVREPTTAYASAGLVIDNSVSMRWLVASGKASDQRYALNVQDAIRDNGLQVLVPYLWCYEAANVSSSYVRSGEIEHELASGTLNALHRLFTVVIDKSETPQALFAASILHGVSSYDASYLLLALSEGLPLATLDKQMRKSAKGMGIQIFAA